MFRTRKAISLFFIIAGFTFVGTVNCSEGNSQQVVEQQERQKAFNFELKDLEGKIHRLSDFEGKVVILDFWDTWCPPCRQEIPGFVELHDSYKDSGFVMIGIAFARFGPAAVSDFMKDYKIEYLSLLADQNVIDGFGGITSIPTTYVIDKKGNIYKKHVGFAPKSTFEKEIKVLLTEEL